jgi:hypothetical protein
LADLTTFNRQAVKSALVDNIAAQLDGTTKVTTYDPGPRNLHREHIFVQATTGNIDNPVVARTLHPHDDRFTINFMVYVYAAGKADGDVVGNRCEELMNAINIAVYEDITIGDSDGVIDVTLASVDGPDVFPYSEGWAGIGEVAVEAHVRIYNR